MAVKPWVKLDEDWYSDDKFIGLKAKYGKARVVDALNIICAMGHFFGVIDMNDPAQAEWVRRHMDMSAKEVEKAIGRCAEFGIVDADSWRSFRKVTSRRARSDGAKRAKRKEAAKGASEAAALKRMNTD